MTDTDERYAVTDNAVIDALNAGRENAKTLDEITCEVVDGDRRCPDCGRQMKGYKQARERVRLTVHRLYIRHDYVGIASHREFYLRGTEHV